MKNMTPQFKWVKSTWTTEIFLREKSQLIFSDRSIIDNSSHCSYTWRVRMSKIFELQSTICIRRFNRIIDIINKIKELMSPQIQSLENYVNMSNRGCYIVFDTGISNNKSI